MGSQWTLLEYRPGRYIKVTSQGRFMGLATEAEIRAWFAAQGIESEPRLASEPLTPSPPSTPRSAANEVVIWGPKPRPDLPRDVAETPPEPSKLQTAPEPQPPPPSAPRSAVDEVVIWGRPPAREPPRDVDETLPAPAERFPEPESQPVQADELIVVPQPAPPESEPQPLPSQPQESPPELELEPVPERAGEDSPEPELSPVQLEKPPLEPMPSPTPSEQPTLVVQAQLPLDQAEPPAAVPAVAPLRKRRGEPAPIRESQAPAGQAEELPPEPLPEIPAGEAEMPPVEAEPELRDERIEIAGTEPQPEAAPDGLPEPPPEPGAESITEMEVRPLPDEIEIPAPEPEPDSLPEDAHEAAPVPKLEPLLDPPEQAIARPLPEPPPQVVEPILEPAPPSLHRAPRATPSGARNLPSHAAGDEEAWPITLSRAPSSADEPPVGDDALDRWLWVDPRHESGYSPATFDLLAFLRRAIALFQAKPWAGGRQPGRVMVHPDQLADGLLEVANDLNLNVVTDPTVTAGTYRLALSEEQVS